MKKASTLLVMAIIVSYQLSYAQVTRQYQDQDFSETTVVIKDDKATSDMDVLNSYFDIDNVGVGQIIRITTENAPPKTPEAPKAPVEQKVVEQVDPIVVDNAPKNIAVKKAPIQQAETPKAEKSVGASVETPKRAVRSSGGSSAAKVRRFAGNLQKKRVKKKKRKRVNRKNGRCYRF